MRVHSMIVRLPLPAACEKCKKTASLPFDSSRRFLMTRLTPRLARGSICGLVFLTMLSLAQSAEDPSVERMKKDLYFLASEECEGRGVETEGINKAANYIAD